MVGSKYIVVAVSIAVLLNIIPLCRVASAQESTELAFILSCNPIQDVTGVERDHTHFDLHRIQRSKLLFTGAIRFYQLFISSQDMPSCNFVPSCSQFGAEAIRRLGVLRGILLTSDRLQRCNSMSISRYQTDYKSGRLIDTVQTYAETAL